MIEKRLIKNYERRNTPRRTEKRVKERRDVANEGIKIQAGKKSPALSSHQPLFYHDIPTEAIKVLTQRHTVGHKKYIPEITMNLNWREGLHDAHYIMDRYNHMWEHLLGMQDADDSDDHFAGVIWNIGFMIEARRVRPDLVAQILGQSKYAGATATEMKEKLLKEQK